MIYAHCQEGTDAIRKPRADDIEFLGIVLKLCTLIQIKPRENNVSKLLQETGISMR